MHWFYSIKRIKDSQNRHSTEWCPMRFDVSHSPKHSTVSTNVYPNKHQRNRQRSIVPKLGAGTLLSLTPIICNMTAWTDANDVTYVRHMYFRWFMLFSVLGRPFTLCVSIIKFTYNWICPLVFISLNTSCTCLLVGEHLVTHMQNIIELSV